MEKIKSVTPVIGIKGKYYKVALLGFALNDQEFYYHFLYPKKRKKRFWDYSNQEETGRPEHITFHNNGLIHLKLNQDKHIGRYQAGAQIYTSDDRHVRVSSDSFISTDLNTITPLLIHSIYPIDGEYELPCIDDVSDIKEKNVLNVNNGFSVILFLTPASIDHNDFLSHFWLNYSGLRICGNLLGAHAGRILAWRGWAIDYILTDLTMELPLNLKFDVTFSFAYIDLQTILKKILIHKVNNQSIYPKFTPPLIQNAHCDKVL